MNKQILAAVLAMPLAISSAFAQEADGPTVKVRGFGTGALTWTNTDRAEFGRPNQAAGARKDPRTGVDSNLGLQADVAVNGWLSLTGQGVVRKDAEDDFGADLTWAFAKARLNDEVSLRIGRTGLPVFMISDYRNVGYASTFLRAPNEMYSQVPFESVDGVDLTWQHGFGDTTVTTQVTYGRAKGKLAYGLRAEGEQLLGLNVVAEHGPFTLRFGRTDAKVTVTDWTSLAGLLTTLRGTGATYNLPQLATFANELEARDKDASFTSVGLGMDWNNIVLQGEYAKRKTDSYVNDTTSWYAMGGYRFGKVLPYVMHAKLAIDGHPTNTVPANVAALAPLRAGAARLPYTGVGQGEQSTTSVGVRWDLYRSIALKAQIDRVQPKVGSGLLLNPQPGFHRDVTVGAVAVDFVF
ncbi:MULTISPECIES: hypothetical protein [Massilia]|uniref:Porin n=1 Tax=Massilia haematophila TaxID=457923 RepID=A0ABV7PPJ4_9BURK|nr:hypothetical protein [Massilia sp.]HBZ05388.1 hypothetical protein [Massilia sp.]